MTDNLADDLQKILDESTVDTTKLMMKLVSYVTRYGHQAWDEGYKKGKEDKA